MHFKMSEKFRRFGLSLNMLKVKIPWIQFWCMKTSYIYIYILDVTKTLCWLSDTADDHLFGIQVSVWLYLGDENIQKFL